jgi:threonyl-tRNA synthetase
MKTHDRLFSIRHSLAHLLAMAVLKIDPKAQFGTGPVTDNGFYYDILLSDNVTVSDKDFKNLEKSMRGFIAKKLDFTREEISLEKAKELFASQTFKLELIDEIAARGETITIYHTDDFVDLCQGPHIDNTSEITPDAFKLFRLAGAYWKASEDNRQLLRIAGLAFETKEALDHYIWQQEEAKKRDHRKIGKELDLFVFSDLVGAGLPLWTPKGTVLRDLLDEYVWQLRKRYEYARVEIPHITKKDLYEVSGHWDKFKDELFRVTTREGHEFAMKPMNCPHHTQIYDRKQWSYRELPQRYANSTMCYRDEQSGELAGLSRVRSFTQDDAHVFCRIAQIKEEMLKVWEIIHTFYGSFGFELRIRISTHDSMQPEKYLGDKQQWEIAENMLAEVAKEKKATTSNGVGEAAFYGPKLDFLSKDALGREWQVATIQLDFIQPERFNLTCINESGEKERIVMIHAAIMGSIDRFLSILIEHFAGNFPLWLAPVQAVVVPIGEAHHEYAKEIFEQLKHTGLRVTLRDDNESLGKKIRESKLQKIPYTLVIGDQEVESKTVTLESRDQGKIGALTLSEIIEKFQEEITSKTILEKK